MFLGDYHYVIDAKNRLFIPAQFREELGERFVMCKSETSPCISVWTEERFGEYLEEIKSTMSMTARRYALQGANTMVLDKMGRVTVNTDLCSYAALTKSIVVYGVGDGAEIWDEDAFKAELSRGETEHNARAVMGK